MTDEQLAAFYMIGNVDNDIDRNWWWADFREIYEATFADPEVRRIAQETADKIRNQGS